ncbi:MAG TPA: helicase-related protein [Candidatus Magasanikbacteria bacterium]|nr:helicase-related protein [Candidatus Magasanikbacteria bacterium]
MEGKQMELFPKNHQKRFLDMYCLPFEGFTVDNRPDWFTAVKEIVKEIDENRNPCLIGKSGSGKTVVAILVHYVLQSRAILIAPTTNLVNEHCKLYQKVTGKKDVVKIIGEIPEKKRVWNNCDDKLIICTAEVFISDFQKGKVALNCFDFFMIDETHHAVKEHAFVKAAKIFNDTGKNIFSLTATLGDCEQEAQEIKKNCFIQTVIELQVPMLSRSERKIDIGLNGHLKYLHPIFEEIIGGITLEFEMLLGLKDVKIWMTEQELKELEKIVAKENNDDFVITAGMNKSYRSGLFLLAKYRKVMHAYRLVMNESYASFLEYTKTLPDKKKSGIALLHDPRFEKIIHYVSNIKDLHPKEKFFLEEIHKIKGRSMIFFQNKTTAKNIKALLKSIGCKTGYIFGGKDKKTEKAKEILKELKTCGMEHLLVTSVAEEGITLPGVDVVINYNPPTSKTARIQRTGRIGRMTKGESIFLVMKNSFEQGLYWKTVQRKPKPKIAGDFIKANIPNKKRKTRRGNDPRQTTLF